MQSTWLGNLDARKPAPSLTNMLVVQKLLALKLGHFLVSKEDEMETPKLTL
ncbi:hypothetical protein NTGM5_820009 [Candidatus Nitrotoga sp. M5]|nr:hypothetical protein NTGM5_820009 [Candidatus Nitrotoga sp. M5]